MEAIVVQLVLFSTVGACVSMFQTLRRRVKQQQSTKTKVILWYACISFLPLILFSLLFLATVGLEELTGEAWISELFGRSLVLVGAIATGLALLGNFVFVVTVVLIKPELRR